MGERGYKRVVELVEGSARVNAKFCLSVTSPPFNCITALQSFIVYLTFRTHSFTVLENKVTDPKFEFTVKFYCQSS